jgi:hypothetical protein
MKKAEQVYDAARGHFNRHYESSLRVNGKKMTDQMPGAEFFEPISSGGLKNTSKAETMLRSYGLKPFASQEGDPQSFLRSVNQSRNQGRLQFGGIKTFDVPAEAPR